MAQLLYTNKIESAGPTAQVSFRTETFQVDSYRIRAASGINNSEVKYSITWICLSQAEAEALVAQFNNSKGVELIQYTPPLENTEFDFTVESYSSALYRKQAPYTYNVSATFIKEYALS